jgi:homocitrate synthase NifV
MIRLTDRTLSCLEGKKTAAAEAARFLALLIQAGPDAIELSEAMYSLLAPLPEFPAYVLRIERAADCERYPDISRFVCRMEAAAGVCAEIIINDMREAYTIARFAEAPLVRVRGLDDCLLGDYRQSFAHLKSAFAGRVEFCPGNRYHLATALAAEWVQNEKDADIVTSFGGLGGFAATEEVMLILRLQRLRKPGKTYEFVPEMADLLRRMSGEALNKPILGKHLFHVKSSIHVDGILKLPKCYEPFPPEIIGQTRQIVRGKQSGAAV